MWWVSYYSLIKTDTIIEEPKKVSFSIGHGNGSKYCHFNLWILQTQRTENPTIQFHNEMMININALRLSPGIMFDVAQMHRNLRKYFEDVLAIYYEEKYWKYCSHMHTPINVQHFPAIVCVIGIKGCDFN